MQLPNRICVFCGSSSGRNPAYTASAVSLGKVIADHEITLIYGGACVGLMGAIADAALESGGKVIGVIPRAIHDLELEHRGLTELHVVGSMHERKALMANLAKAFIALPGGFGTLDELCEILTWAQLGMHRKPIGLLNVAGYYDSLIEFLDCATSEQFVGPGHRRLLVEGTDPRQILQDLGCYKARGVDKWLDDTA